MMPAVFRPVGVKICGLNAPEAFDAAVAFGADWIGFNFFPPSPRFVTPAQAAIMSARARGGPRRVGLFVDPTDAALAEALAEIPLDALQIYAAPDRASEIRRRFGRDVWHAVGIASTTDLPRAADGFDGFIIESKPPKGATRPGGNALAIDWTLTAGWEAPKPWLLAGGLTPENVAGAIRASGATAVDVSSGVERAPGIKDPERIRAFIQAARAG